MITTRHTDARTAQATLRSVYALAPQAARIANHATTVDRDPSDPFRATVFVGEIVEIGHGAFGCQEKLVDVPVHGALPSSVVIAGKGDVAFRVHHVRARIGDPAVGADVAGAGRGCRRRADGGLQRSERDDDVNEHVAGHRIPPAE